MTTLELLSQMRVFVSKRNCGRCNMNMSEATLAVIKDHEEAAVVQIGCIRCNHIAQALVSKTKTKPDET